MLQKKKRERADFYGPYFMYFPEYMITPYLEGQFKGKD